MTRAISEARPVRRGPPTTDTGASDENTPPLHVRPTASAMWPGFGSSALVAGGAPSPATRTTERPVPALRPSTVPSKVCPSPRRTETTPSWTATPGVTTRSVSQTTPATGRRCACTWTIEAATVSAAAASCVDRAVR